MHPLINRLLDYLLSEDNNCTSIYRECELNEINEDEFEERVYDLIEDYLDKTDK